MHSFGVSILICGLWSTWLTTLLLTPFLAVRQYACMLQGKEPWQETAVVLLRYLLILALLPIGLCADSLSMALAYATAPWETNAHGVGGLIGNAIGLMTIFAVVTTAAEDEHGWLINPIRLERRMWRLK